jgi:N-acetylglucosaminyldiphosphoundecaprenol N-acetyl-beta-D-mannosaminyltransferase
MNNSVNFDRPVYFLLGLPIDCLTTQQALQVLEQSALQSKPCFLSTPNLNFLISARQDPDFRMSVIDSDLVVADGMPLVWAARWMDIPLPERVAGSTLVERLRRDPNGRRRLKVFFFGGPEGVAEKANQILTDETSGLTGAGAHYPGFGTVDAMCAPEVVAQINDAQPDVVIVSLGAKKGQLWIQRMRRQLNAPVISHLGAVVNFIAGTVARAPMWMQKTGLEWVWRMYEEPSLFKRYWSDGKAFLSLLWFNVRPLSHHAKQLKSRLGHLPPLEFEVQSSTPSEHLILIRGRALVTDLAPLRQALAHLCMQDTRDIRIDLSGCQCVDPGFLGLLCLVLKHQRSIGKKLELTGLSPNLKEHFELHGAGFML